MHDTKPANRRALLSVANKVGLVDFAKQLVQLNFKCIATGNTAKLLKENNIPVTDVCDITQFPEMLGGRVKTLHPHIHAGILARRGEDDSTLEEHNIAPIDLVVVNLYPFEKTVAQPGCTLDEAIEQIDIGGPTLLRAAAKNFKHVTAIIDPADYNQIIEELTENGEVSLQTRQQLALSVFRRTAEYEYSILDYFNKVNPEAKIKMPFFDDAPLRYGENPHQVATLYKDTKPRKEGTLARARCLQGKALSYNNFMDADAALRCVRMWPSSQPACAIIKHATPCGVAVADHIEEAYSKALSTDPTSAFGGIVAINQTLNQAMAERLKQQFVEVIIAPDIEDVALDTLSSKKNCRILICDTEQNTTKNLITTIDGGRLYQDNDNSTIERSECKDVGKITATEQQMDDLWFAWNVVRQVKSNAIVFAKDGKTLGIGSGQTSRVFSVRIAALKAEEAGFDLNGAVMASDAFFPFSDGVEAAIKHGITAVIQPGGSKRDAEVITSADQAGVAMVFTGRRHFRH
jgi:phosphoribosylaminoimidazolecarboxamide formyltransferase / IMP cyclohydrolase